MQQYYSKERPPRTHVLPPVRVCKIKCVTASLPLMGRKGKNMPQTTHPLKVPRESETPDIPQELIDLVSAKVRTQPAPRLCFTLHS